MSGTSGIKVSQLTKRMFKNASVYGLSLILVRASGILLLPLYWKVLTPTDFGIIAVYQIVSQFLVPLLDLGMSGAIQRLFFEWKKEERPRHIASVWTFSLIYSLIICAFLTFAGPIAVHLLFKSFKSVFIFRLAIWAGFFQNLTMVPTSLFRSREQLKAFATYSGGQFLIQAILTIFFLFVMHLGANGYIFGSFFAWLLMGAACTIYMLKQARFPFKIYHLLGALNYALPTTPATILEGASGVIDRFYLEKYAALDVLGIYSLGRQVASVYNLFLQALKTSWVPFVYRIVSERDDAPSVISQMSIYYLLALVPPALFVSLLAKELILFINNPKYFGVYPFVPYFVLGFFILGLGHIFGRGLDLAKKTKYYWLINSAYIATSIAALTLLVPKFGVYGAIASFILSNIAREIVQIGLSHYFYRRRVQIASILKIAMVTTVAVVIAIHVERQNIYSSLLIKTVIILFAWFAMVLWTIGKKGVWAILSRSFIRPTD